MTSNWCFDSISIPKSQTKRTKYDPIFYTFRLIKMSLSKAF